MDYLISSTQLTTCTGLSKVLDGEISHDRFTRMLSEGMFDSRSLWLQNKVVACEISRAADTDENEINCYHYDHGTGRAVKGVGFITALLNARRMNVPVMRELIRKDLKVVDERTSCSAA